MDEIDFSKVRLICSDIDGTLLKNETELSNSIKADIRKLRSKGIRFTFATGRVPYEVEHLFQDIPNDVPYVAGNGAIVKSGSDFLINRHFMAGSLRLLVEKYTALGVTVIFTVNDEERPYCSTEWSEANIGLFPGLDKPVDKSIWSIPIQRMFFYHPEGKYLQECRKDLAEHEDEYAISFQNRKSIQIAPFGCTKASGIEVLSQILNVPRSQIMCIGDADNDIEMIRYAGIGVAVNNASNELKREADYVTSLQSSEGVKEVIEKCCRN